MLIPREAEVPEISDHGGGYELWDQEDPETSSALVAGARLGLYAEHLGSVSPAGKTRLDMARLDSTRLDWVEPLCGVL